MYNPSIYEPILDYQQRDVIIRFMGYSNYNDYLQSDLWRHIRRRVFGYKGNLCWLCRRKADHVHHHRYTIQNLRGRRFRDLYPICVVCHEIVEFDEGTKRPLIESSELFTWILNNKKLLRELREGRSPNVDISNNITRDYMNPYK